MNEQLKIIFDKILSDKMLFDDEVNFLVRTLSPILGKEWYIHVDELEDLIEETWEDAQEEILSEISVPSHGYDISKKKLQSLIFKYK